MLSSRKLTKETNRAARTIATNISMGLLPKTWMVRAYNDALIAEQTAITRRSRHHLQSGGKLSPTAKCAAYRAANMGGLRRRRRSR